MHLFISGPSVGLTEHMRVVNTNSCPRKTGDHLLDNAVAQADRQQNKKSAAASRRVEEQREVQEQRSYIGSKVSTSGRTYRNPRHLHSAPILLT